MDVLDKEEGSFKLWPVVFVPRGDIIKRPFSWILAGGEKCLHLSDFIQVYSGKSLDQSRKGGRMHRNASQGDEEGDGRAVVASFGRGERKCGRYCRCKGSRTKTFDQVSRTIEESVEKGKNVLSEGVGGEGPCSESTAAQGDGVGGRGSGVLIWAPNAESSCVFLVSGIVGDGE